MADEMGGLSKYRVLLFNYEQQCGVKGAPAITEVIQVQSQSQHHAPDVVIIPSVQKNGLICIQTGT